MESGTSPRLNNCHATVKLLYILYVLDTCLSPQFQMPENLTSFDVAIMLWVGFGDLLPPTCYVKTSQIEIHIRLG